MPKNVIMIGKRLFAKRKSLMRMAGIIMIIYTSIVKIKFIVHVGCAAVKPIQRKDKVAGLE